MFFKVAERCSSPQSTSSVYSYKSRCPFVRASSPLCTAWMYLKALRWPNVSPYTPVHPELPLCIITFENVTIYPGDLGVPQYNCYARDVEKNYCLFSLMYLSVLMYRAVLQATTTFHRVPECPNVSPPRCISQSHNVSQCTDMPLGVLYCRILMYPDIPRCTVPIAQ